MADIGHKLFIRYGLTTAPTLAQQREWVSMTRAMIRQGSPAEMAGRAAARHLFLDFERMVYASEADTIEMLLRKADE